MRKFLINIALAVMTVSAAAQESGDAWKGTLSFDPIVTNFEHSQSFNFQLTGSRQVHDKFAIGLGTGVEYNWKFTGDVTVPLFLNINMDDYSKDESPFLDLRAGYSFNFCNFDYGGIFFNPTLGYRFGRFGIGIGYQGSIMQFKGAKWSSAMNVRLAYYFGYHGTKASRAIVSGDFSAELSGELPIDATKETLNNSKVKVNPGIGLRFAYLLPIKNLSVGPSVGIKLFKLQEVEDDYKCSEKEFLFEFDVRSKYRFREITFANKFYPWVQLDLGYQYSLYERFKSGFHYSPAVGISYDVRDGFSIDLGIGYSNTSLCLGEDDDWNNVYREVGALRISLGYTF